LATVTYVGAQWTTTAGNKSVASFTPAVGDLLVVVCANSGRTTAQPPTLSITVQGITFTRHGTAMTKNTSADSAWVFVADSFCTAASACTLTMTQASDTGGGLFLFRVSGMTRAGLAAIKQVGKQDNAAAGTPSITMGAAVLTGNPCIGFVFNGTNSATTTAPPTTPAWTEDFDNGYNTPTNGAEACHVSSGETRITIPWTAASASVFGSMLIELDASAASTAPWPDRSDIFQMNPLIAQ
jgi:hypothetical protein